MAQQTFEVMLKYKVTIDTEDYAVSINKRGTGLDLTDDKAVKQALSMAVYEEIDTHSVQPIDIVSVNAL
jgi:hypothetical protein